MSTYNKDIIIIIIGVISVFLCYNTHLVSGGGWVVRAGMGMRAGVGIVVVVGMRWGCGSWWWGLGVGVWGGDGCCEFLSEHTHVIWCDKCTSVLPRSGRVRAGVGVVGVEVVGVVLVGVVVVGWEMGWGCIGIVGVGIDGDVG